MSKPTGTMPERLRAAADDMEKSGVRGMALLYLREDDTMHEENDIKPEDTPRFHMTLSSLLHRLLHFVRGDYL